MVSPKIDNGLPSGVISIPMGLWANVIIGPETEGCGTPKYKGVYSEVMPTKLPVKGIRELFADLMNKRSATS